MKEMGGSRSMELDGVVKMRDGDAGELLRHKEGCKTEIGTVGW